MGSVPRLGHSLQLAPSRRRRAAGRAVQAIVSRSMEVIDLPGDPGSRHFGREPLPRFRGLPRLPTVLTYGHADASRGAAAFRLRVPLRHRAYHSGNWGGLLRNPATVLMAGLSWDLGT
jgi:hypothetical protein